MAWQAWWLFVATDFVLCLAPGPTVLFAVSQALRSGAARSVWASGGILSGNALYFALSGAGLGALLVALPRVNLMVKYGGAAYLLHLGLRAFRGPAGELQRNDESRDAPAHVIFGRAFATQIANPKAFLFFSALLPQFIRSGNRITPQMLILGATSITFECLVLYRILAARAAPLLRQPRYSTMTNRVAGGLLIGAGVGLATAGGR